MRFSTLSVYGMFIIGMSTALLNGAAYDRTTVADSVAAQLERITAYEATAQIRLDCG